MYKFSAITLQVFKLLDELDNGSLFVCLGGEDSEDLQLFSPKLIEKEFKVALFEKYPSRCFRCTDPKRTDRGYFLSKKVLLEDLGFKEPNYMLFVGKERGDLSNYLNLSFWASFGLYPLSKDSPPAFLCLDTTNLNSISSFRKRTYREFPEGLPNKTAILLNSQPSRNPNTAIKVAQKLLGCSTSYFRGSVQYIARGKHRTIRELSLWSNF